MTFYQRNDRQPNKQARFTVYRDGRWADTVYFVEDMTADEVKESLIDHDGYPCDIAVYRSKI